ncbi:ubiquitin family protein [Colletotrichum tamarilloi]|uniref:Ubiquitin family protein n=1 Tax=Colletotrichum tamarilloi TaxID=1209934 RepID=A0ABQ9RIP7_9PEZI|nr:ubiquitin family protein [Colletotrichum tamarilloi]KAI3527900.1 ubiquitin family protein [Colletotrichum filicis]KAK1504514.1 ubiquitin family protein [Colletotrichum tamarilloi]
MASEASSSAAPSAPEATSEHLSVNLQVLSPSTAATSSRPLVFPGLAATTTVRQLKEKIRQALPLKPTDAQQRLIYRGRPLAQDGDTLLTVLGEEVIRTTDQQTIHLVLRDVTEPHRSTTPTPALVRGSSPAPPTAHFPGPFGTTGQPQHVHHHGSQPTAAAFTRRTPLHPTSNPMPFPAPPQIPANLTLQQLQQLQAQQHQSMTAWMNGLQREAMNRAMAHQQINQNQAMRASMGMHGVGDTPAAVPNPVEPTRGRASPLSNPEGHTYVREGLMPNGQTYRVTVNETFLGGQLNVQQPGSQGTSTPLSTADVQTILRAADSNQATLAMTNAMQRSASSTSLANGGSSVGVTTPYYPTPGSRASSRRPTPDPTARSVSGGSRHSTNAQQQAPSGPEVYILSSPQGPRALLINNATDSYYTPRGQPHTTSTLHQTASALARMRGRPQHVAWPGAFVTPPPHHEEQQPAHQAEPQPQVQQQHQPEAQPPMHQPQGQPAAAAVPAHPNNPGIAPLIAQVWPHFWLVVRLALFVWWFTSPNAGWSRWITVISIAISIFVLNTGLLNNYFDQAVGPVRRHMENLLPLAAPNNVNEPVRPRDDQAVVGRDGQPDPTRAAARLVAQRRHDNANWLMDQVRRLERAGLLFLASIAPGVAERHIAHLEAEARAERQRREEAEAAAAAAAEAAANPENNTENQNNDETNETSGRNDTEGGENEAQRETHGGDQRRAEEQQPLLAL